MTQSRMPRGRRLRILTWHVHGNYLYALGQVPHDFVIPVLPGNPAGYGALGSRIPWGDNLVQVPAAALRDQRLDCVLYQSRQNLEDARLLLDDGKLVLRVTDHGSDRIVTTVEVGGALSDNKGLNVPDVVLPMAALTEKRPASWAPK